MYRRLKVINLRLEENGVNHLKNQPMMLRRLAQSEQIKSLEVLAAVSEPIKGYSRHSQGKLYSSLSPLTRFVDACYSESFEARDFKRLVENFIRSRDLRQAKIIETWLELWQVNHQKLVSAESSPAIKEIIPLSEMLRTVSQAGLEALHLIMNGKQADQSWLQAKYKVLEEARKPVAECQLAILPDIELLLGSLKK